MCLIVGWGWVVPYTSIGKVSSNYDHLHPTMLLLDLGTRKNVLAWMAWSEGEPL